MVFWRKAEVNGRVTKLPISPWSGKAASCDKPQTWSTYQHVLYGLHRFPCQGIGFVFTRHDPFCGMISTTAGLLMASCTGCPGDDWAFGELYRTFSLRHGAHIPIKATIGKGGGPAKLNLGSGRYFTVTGTLVGHTLCIQKRQETLEKSQAECFPTARTRASPVPATPVDLSDEELIGRARNARYGDRFQRLWAGDASDYGNDHSRADLALCHALAFWSGGDTERIDRLFRHSGLMRDKWDRRTGDRTCGRGPSSRPH